MIRFQNIISALKSNIWLAKWFLSFKRNSRTNDLNCRVKLSRQHKVDSKIGIFNIGLLGSIHASNPNQKAIAEVFINDQASVLGERQPVYSSAIEWKLENSEIFCFSSDLGRMPKRHTEIAEWTEIAQIHCDWLVFPRQGKRMLQFVVYIFSSDDGEQMGKAECFFEYENQDLGYIDKRENMQKADTLAIPLAFAISAADKRLYQCEIDLIKGWARQRFNLKNASNWTRRRIEKALDKTLSYFQAGKGLNLQNLCEEITVLADEGQRYDILELCLKVAGANGQVLSEELKLLHELGLWLEVDRERYLQMQEKTLPVTMHEGTDAKSVLGLEEATSKEEAQGLLNKEFRKWNSRVTNSDPEIRKQADHMLNLIAHARNQYVS
jgi:hypothetical protein